MESGNPMSAEQLDEEFAAFFRFGYGETLVSHWFVKAHALVRLVKAVEAEEPGTVLTGQDVAHEGPVVWLAFHDATAVRRIAKYLTRVADDMEWNDFVGKIENPEEA